MSSNNYFSIIICTYNCENYINETIKSVINQSYQNYEIIIVDDGSKDNTVNLIKKNFNQNKYLKLFSNENHGMSYSRNFAISKTSNAWIVILDHDDICFPDRLEKYNNYINLNHKIDLYFSDMVYFNDQKSFLRFEKQFNKNQAPYNLNLNKNFGYYNLLQYGCFIGSSSVAFKKSVYHKTSGFKKEYKFLSDYIFFLELAEIGNIFCIKSPLVKWRMHENQSTEVNNHLYIKEMMNLYSQLYFKKHISLLLKIKLFIRHFIMFLKFVNLKLKK